MNQDAPDSRVFDNLTAILYDNHPIRVPILGTSETIRRITPQVLYDCHRAFYTPGNMILCVVGDVEPNRVAEIAGAVLGSEKRPVGEKRCHWPEEMRAREKTCSARMEVAMPTFELGFKCEPTGRGERAIRREVVGDLAAEALFGESSPLYLRLYEQGLIDSSCALKRTIFPSYFSGSSVTSRYQRAKSSSFTSMTGALMSKGSGSTTSSISVVPAV